MNARIYAVYILATRKDGPLYIGITNDLERRIEEHKSHAIKGMRPGTTSTGLSTWRPSTIRTRRSSARRLSRRGAAPGKSRS